MFRSVVSRGLFSLGSRMYSCAVRPSAAMSVSLLARFPQQQQISLLDQLPQVDTPSRITPPSSIMDEVVGDEQTSIQTDNTMYMDSVMRKRRLKMKKHKLRKRRKAQRSLKKRLGKI